MIIVRLQEKFRLRASEWLMSGVLLSWGFTLFMNPNIFSTTPTMAELSHMASQPLWAIVLFLIGLVRITALVINGAWRPSPHIRAACAFITCFVWLEIVFGLLRVDIPNTGVGVYSLFLAFDTYNVFRAMADARIADDVAKGL